MELAGAILVIGKMLFRPIRNSWKYHSGIDKYTGILDEKSEDLNARKDDVELRLRAELLLEKTPKKEVELWLGRVVKMNAEIEALKEDIKKRKWVSRARLGSSIVRKTKKVNMLYEKGVFHDGLVEPLPNLAGDIMPVIAQGGGSTFDTKMEEIWSCLMDEEVRKIGVYGMGGIGKTTALKHINNRLVNERGIFERVIWVTVSKGHDDMKSEDSILMLQDEIARWLKLDLSVLKNDLRAAKLHAALSALKKHVLILDDVWDVYDLEEVGIPEPTLENGCKLVVTTRSLDVCRGMSCKGVRMELLTDSETRSLFLDIVGRGVLSAPNLDVVVSEVIEECSRLPLAIKTIAGSFKGVLDYNEWRAALADLKAFTNVTGSVVLGRLKFSYDRLSNKKLKDCLLYCALYPEDYDILRSELIEYLIVEGMIDEMETRQAQFETGHTMLNRLENACLLEGSINTRGKKCVKMHDLVRDMAVQITSVSPRFMVLPTVGPTRMPSGDKWPEDVVRVSFMRTAMSYVPSNASPRCPVLSTLLLTHIGVLKSIPECFFFQMEGLKVLDLSYTGIENLPESVSDLVNLTALLLRGCKKLIYVPSLANLKALKRLDLWDTRLTILPEGMRELVNLRCLDLCTPDLNVLLRGVLPNLSQLQSLILHRFSSKRVTVSGEELASLRKLETFIGILESIEDLNIYVESLKGRTLAEYILQVGFSDNPTTYGPRGDSRCKYKRVVVMKNCVERQYSIALPRAVEQICIVNCANVTSLCTAASLTDARGLKCCVVSNCGDVEYLLSSTSSANLLKSLEELQLTRLVRFCGLVRGLRDSSPAFSSLRKLSIQLCPEMKYLFTPVLLPNLQNLEAICVKYCEKMEELVCSSSDQIEQVRDSDVEFLLPKLRLLELWDLPNLKSVCNYEKAVLAETLQTISISDCPKLRVKFALSTVDNKLSPTPSLQSIKVDRDWWASLQWEIPEAKDVLEPLCEFWEDGIVDEIENYF